MPTCLQVHVKDPRSFPIFYKANELHEYQSCFLRNCEKVTIIFISCSYHTIYILHSRPIYSVKQIIPRIHKITSKGSVRLKLNAKCIHVILCNGRVMFECDNLNNTLETVYFFLWKIQGALLLIKFSYIDIPVFRKIDFCWDSCILYQFVSFLKHEHMFIENTNTLDLFNFQVWVKGYWILFSPFSFV